MMPGKTARVEILMTEMLQKNVLKQFSLIILKFNKCEERLTADTVNDTNTACTVLNILNTCSNFSFKFVIQMLSLTETISAL